MTLHRSNQRSSKAFDVLDGLPDEEREALVLSSFYGLARDEIASIVGASVDAVDGLLQRARADLRLLLTSSRWSESQAA